MYSLYFVAFQRFIAEARRRRPSRAARQADDFECKGDAPILSNSDEASASSGESVDSQQSAFEECGTAVRGESGDSEDESEIISKRVNTEKVHLGVRGEKPIRSTQKIENKFLNDVPLRELGNRGVKEKAKIEVIDDVNDNGYSTHAVGSQEPSTGDETQQFLSGLEKLAGATTLRSGMFSEKIMDIPAPAPASGDDEEQENDPHTQNINEKTFVTKMDSGLSECDDLKGSALGVGRGKVTREYQ